MHIGSQPISPEAPVLIIAEIGVNHDGNVSRALELVDAAAAAGADAVKLQVFRAHTLVHGQGLLADYQKQIAAADSSAELLRRYELSEAELARVHVHARARGLLTVATPFSMSDVPVCGRLGLDALKIASPDIVNVPLLLAARETSLPLLLSTGAATLEEIDATHTLLCESPRSYLHCVSSYPTPDEQAHLGFIPQLIARYGGHPAVGGIGYSDHAQSVLAGALAVAAGAVLLERHLTYDRAAAGPDHAASSDPAEFREYVRLARLASALRGKGPKRVLDIEEDVRRVSRQSLVLRRDIAADEPITAAHLTTQRPGTGLPAAAYFQVLGRHTRLTQKAGTMLTPEMLA